MIDGYRELDKKHSIENVYEYIEKNGPVKQDIVVGAFGEEAKKTLRKLIGRGKIYYTTCWRLDA